MSRTDHIPELDSLRAQVSDPGLGTTVSVYLPTLPSHIAEEPLPHGHECILFVDDDPTLAHFGGEMLQSLGHYAVVRLSAAEAWEAFKIALNDSIC